MRSYVETYYLNNILSPMHIREMVGKAIRTLNKLDKESPFDSIVFAGISGSALGYIMAYRMGKAPIVVRRETCRKASHSACIVEGYVDVRSYVVIDDFMESGKTVKRVLNTMGTERKGSKCVGLYFHTTQKLLTPDDLHKRGKIETKTYFAAGGRVK